METKTISAIIGVSLIASGGVYTFDQKQIDTLETEVQNIQIAKGEVLKDFIYSQVRLHETPSIDLTFATPTEIQQAYIDLATDKAVELKPDDDVFIRLREKAVSEGTACK